MEQQGKVLVIAGSDSGGGAGIQADIKTITMLGGYASTAITAVTSQNTKGVFGVVDLSPEFVASQIDAVLSDIGADIIKTGMLHNANIIEAVISELDKYPNIKVVIDPVMVATSGDSLLDEAAINIIKNELIKRAFLITPNIPEAEKLTGRKIENIDDMFAAASDIIAMGANAVLVKGGHMPGDNINDILLTKKGKKDIFKSRRIKSDNTHGTGCTLASAIACNLANDMIFEHAIINAREYVHEAIKRAQGFGGGCGPLNHNFSISTS